MPIPPVPYQIQITERNGLVTQTWAAWFRELFLRVGGSIADSVADHIADPTGAHAASAISSSPSGNLAANNVQSALVELQTDIDTRAQFRTVTGSRASPISVTAAGGISPTGAGDELIFIQGSGGLIDITANPQIAVGTAVGQRLTLIGRHDTNTVQLDNGTGLALNGTCVLSDSSSITLFWDGANWMEETRNDL